jgi:hypothetical protein
MSIATAYSQTNTRTVSINLNNVASDWSKRNNSCAEFEMEYRKAMKNTLSSWSVLRAKDIEVVEASAQYTAAFALSKGYDLKSHEFLNVMWPKVNDMINKAKVVADWIRRNGWLVAETAVFTTLAGPRTFAMAASAVTAATKVFTVHAAKLVALIRSVGVTALYAGMAMAGFALIVLEATTHCFSKFAKLIAKKTGQVVGNWHLTRTSLAGHISGSLHADYPAPFADKSVMIY